MPAHFITAADVETMPPADVNFAIGNLIGAEPMRRPYIARKGEFLWYCGIAEREIEAKQAWIAEVQDTVDAWERFLVDFDKRITRADRGKISIEVEEHHIRYSDTPGGGWNVIEAIRESGRAVVVSSFKAGWQVKCTYGGQPVIGKSDTMAKAACKCAAIVF